MIGVVIVLMIAALALFPIPITVLAHVSAVPKTFGGFTVRVFGAGVFAARLNVRSRALILTDAQGRERRIAFSRDRTDPNSLASYLDNGFLRVMNLRRIETYATVGIADDAAATAMTLGGLSTAFGAGEGVLHTHFPGLETFSFYEPIYNRDRMELSVRADASVTAFEAVYAFLYALHRKRIYRKKH